MKSGGTGLGQHSEEEDGEEASNSSLPPEETVERGGRHTLLGGGGIEKGTKGKGHKLQQEKFHLGCKVKTSSPTEWWNSEAVPGKVVGTPSFETFGTWLDDVLSNLL